jgi:hypothetical protein
MLRPPFELRHLDRPAGGDRIKIRLMDGAPGPDQVGGMVSHRPGSTSFSHPFWHTLTAICRT